MVGRYCIKDVIHRGPNRNSIRWLVGCDTTRMAFKWNSFLNKIDPSRQMEALCD